MTDYLRKKHDFTNPELVAAYDQVFLWSARFGELLFKHLELRRNLRVLDLACGTGFPLLELAHMLGRSCELVGVDVWKEALERARLKLKVYDLPNVQLVTMQSSASPTILPLLYHSIPFSTTPSQRSAESALFSSSTQACFLSSYTTLLKGSIVGRHVRCATMPGESRAVVEQKKRSLTRKARYFLNIAIRNQPAKRRNIDARETRGEQYDQTTLR